MLRAGVRLISLNAQPLTIAAASARYLRAPAMSVDLVIKNGRVVTPGGVLVGGVAVDGETIVAVGPDATLPGARRTLDARAQYVLPGLIDAHVHMASEEDASIEQG